MNDNERELWVRNDEGLYAMWQASPLAMRKFIRTHRTEIDNYIIRIKNNACWNLACKYDNVNPASKFVVFSKENPHIS